LGNVDIRRCFKKYQICLHVFFGPLRCILGVSFAFIEARLTFRKSITEPGGSSYSAETSECSSSPSPWIDEIVRLGTMSTWVPESSLSSCEVFMLICSKHKYVLNSDAFYVLFPYPISVRCTAATPKGALLFIFKKVLFNHCQSIKTS